MGRGKATVDAMDKGRRPRAARSSASAESGSGLVAMNPRSDGVPRQFQLAGHTIAVNLVTPRKWKHGKNCVGIWLPNDYRIEVLSTCRGTNRQQVFCHEAIHAMLDIAGHDDLSRDEQLVDRLGHLLQQMLTTME